MFHVVIKLIVPLVFFIAPLSVIAHEIGHIIGARIVKADYVKLSIGLGKKVYTYSKDSFEIAVHLLYFLGGYSVNKRDIPYNSFDIIIITLFGPLTNIVLSVIFYVTYIMYPQKFILLFCLFNLWLGITNLIPFRLKNKQSDGYIIFKKATKYDKVD